MSHRNINFRAPKKIVEKLEEMVRNGEARNLSDAVNKVLDRYFFLINGREKNQTYTVIGDQVVPEIRVGGEHDKKPRRLGDAEYRP